MIASAPFAENDSSKSSVEQASAALYDFLECLAGLAKPRAMESLASTDLTFTQLRVLFVTAAADNAPSVHEIAETIHLSVAATGRTVDQLVRMDLVDRREDTIDRRVKRVTMTPRGTALIDEQLSIRHEVVTEFVSGLPDDYRIALTQALRPIVDAEINYFDLLSPNDKPENHKSPAQKPELVHNQKAAHHE